MPGPLPDALAPVTIPVSWVYGKVMERRNRRFDSGDGVRRLPLPVVSVGNLTTGGVGKSPMVAWMADVLGRGGHRPVIAMRGYGARPGALSDEQAEYAARVPSVPVVASPRRFEALRAFLAMHPEVDGVLLDDGFQHRGLERDLDVVLLDARGSHFDDRLLPAGHLREPSNSLRRADAIVMMHVDEPDERMGAAVRQSAGRPPVAWTRHRSARLHVHGRETEVAGIEWLAERRVATMLGVARPEGILRQLEGAGATVVVDVPVRDHEPYDATRLASVTLLCDGLDALVCTGKDWAKLRLLVDLERFPCPIVVPELRLEFVGGEGELEELVLDAFGEAPPPSYHQAISH